MSTTQQEYQHEAYTNTDDGSLVGTPELLLLSKNVIKAPSRINTPVPVPSVYKDVRGEIHNFRVGNKRINLLYSKSQTMRSGDIHKSVQHDFVFSGKVKVWTLSKRGTTHTKIYTANQYIEIPMYVPHIFEFINDSVMAEWWDEPFEAWFYEPYRNIVLQTSMNSDMNIAPPTAIASTSKTPNSTATAATITTQDHNNIKEQGGGEPKYPWPI